MPVDDANTVALLHMDGADASTTFTDESGKTWTAGGNAQIDTAQYKFGGASGLFDGSGDYIDTPDSADFHVSNEDFTIDMWIRPAALNQIGFICAQADSGGADASISWYMRMQADESIIAGIVSGGTLYEAAIAANSYAANTWGHLALIRYSNTIKLFWNGTAGATTANVTGVTANNSTNKPTIGRLGEYNGHYYSGWIDEFRFSKGIARWTANFTPPTLSYQPTGNFLAFF